MDANKLWTSATQKLKGQYPKSLFQVYFVDESIPIAILNHTFYIKGNINVKNFFEKDMQKEVLLKAFSELAANINDIVVITDYESETELFKTIENQDKEKNNEAKKTDKSHLKIKSESISNANLNPKYTFDTFVIGPSNNIAVAACQRVAMSDEISKDNPLFLYGGVGLGKTHLMHAIGHCILDRDPTKKILYISSETFTNELIIAIRDKKNDEFRDKYRNVDLFMIDDVQFIAGKNSVEEELFHTFNDVFAAGKKIVLSSDRPPKDIPHLKDRLKSRFVSGMTVDIQAPDYSTRMAILQSKAESEGKAISKDVIEYIADNVKSNIRELEGSLNKVILYSELSSKDIDINTAKEALKDILVSYKTKEINILRIKEMVADSYSVSVEDLNSKKRTKNIAFPRQVAMYIARNLLDISLPNIGGEFGGRDHTTVMHAIKKVEDEIMKSEITKVKIEKIISDLNG